MGAWRVRQLGGRMSVAVVCLLGSCRPPGREPTTRYFFLSPVLGCFGFLGVFAFLSISNLRDSLAPGSAGRGDL